ncbi:hypothetical protein EMCRGX_G007104 [Ephydatia muelleri]
MITSEDAWLKVFMLPKCRLLAPKRGGRHHKPVPISHLCAQWAKGEFSALWNRASNHRSSGPHPTPNHKSSAVQTAVSLAREGLLSKAGQVLTSSGLAPNNNTTWNLLVSEHPKGTPPTPPTAPPSAAPCLPPDFDIMASLHSFPKDTSCGPFGLRIQHLIEAAEAVLDACGLHFPELLPWSSWCYGQHPALWHPLGTITSEISVQQGDPLGPLLFCLVLQQVVSTIAEDADCASLLFHKWYIDDGVVAGPIAAIARVLAIIQVRGPPLGLYINITKCELFSLSDLSTFPDEMKRSNVPHFEILGAPIGDLVFCAKFVAQKQSEASKLLQLLEAVGSIDPQQAQLSLKRGGLGLRRLSCHSPAAYIASFQSSGLSPSSGNYLSSSVDLYNSLVDPQDSLTLELVGNSHLSQKVLSSKIEDRQFGYLFHSATLTDRARLLSVSSPHTSAWLSITPSPRLNLHLEPAEFQVALKWWLGIPVVRGQSCPHCPSFVLDDFGHHSLSCKHGGDVVSRHNKLRDVFLDFCQRACLGPRLEMGCGAGYTNPQSRPADVLVPNWDLGKPAAFDL